MSFFCFIVLANLARFHVFSNFFQVFFKKNRFVDLPRIHSIDLERL